MYYTKETKINNHKGLEKRLATVLANTLIERPKLDLATAKEMITELMREIGKINTGKKSSYPNDRIQNAIGPHIMAIGEHFEPFERRILMQLTIPTLQKYTSLGLSEEYKSMRDAATLLESWGKQSEVNTRPKASIRIIAFNSDDLKIGGEVEAAIKLAYDKHGGAEHCIISSSTEEIIALSDELKRESPSKKIDTLELIGHGSIYIEGGPHPRPCREHQKLTKVEAEKQRKESKIQLGPFDQIADEMPADVAALVLKLEPKNCRLSICMGGYLKPEAKTKEIDAKFYDEKDHSMAKGRASATMQWTSTKGDSSIPFHEASIAGMVWHTLADEGFFTENRDFSLSATPYMLSPSKQIRPDRSYGFFSASSRDQWETPITDDKKRWAPELSRLEQMRSVTLATPASSKHDLQTTYDYTRPEISRKYT